METYPEPENDNYLRDDSGSDLGPKRSSFEQNVSRTSSRRGSLLHSVEGLPIERQTSVDAIGHMYSEGKLPENFIQAFMDPTFRDTIVGDDIEQHVERMSKSRRPSLRPGQLNTMPLPSKLDISGILADATGTEDIPDSREVSMHAVTNRRMNSTNIKHQVPQELRVAFDKLMTTPSVTMVRNAKKRDVVPPILKEILGKPKTPFHPTETNIARMGRRSLGLINATPVARNRLVAETQQKVSLPYQISKGTHNEWVRQAFKPRASVKIHPRVQKTLHCRGVELTPCEERQEMAHSYLKNVILPSENFEDFEQVDIDIESASVPVAPDGASGGVDRALSAPPDIGGGNDSPLEAKTPTTEEKPSQEGEAKPQATNDATNPKSGHEQVEDDPFSLTGFTNKEGHVISMTEIDQDVGSAKHEQPVVQGEWSKVFGETIAWTPDELVSQLCDVSRDVSTAYKPLRPSHRTRQTPEKGQSKAKQAYDEAAKLYAEDLAGDRRRPKSNIDERIPSPPHMLSQIDEQTISHNSESSMPAVSMGSGKDPQEGEGHGAAGVDVKRDTVTIVPPTPSSPEKSGMGHRHTIGAASNLPFVEVDDRPAKSVGFANAHRGSTPGSPSKPKTPATVRTGSASTALATEGGAATSREDEEVYEEVEDEPMYSPQPVRSRVFGKFDSRNLRSPEGNKIAAGLQVRNIEYFKEVFATQDVYKDALEQAKSLGTKLPDEPIYQEEVPGKLFVYPKQVKFERKHMIKHPTVEPFDAPKSGAKIILPKLRWRTFFTNNIQRPKGQRKPPWAANDESKYGSLMRSKQTLSQIFDWEDAIDLGIDEEDGLPEGSALVGLPAPLIRQCRITSNMSASASFAKESPPKPKLKIRKLKKKKTPMDKQIQWEKEEKIRRMEAREKKKKLGLTVPHEEEGAHSQHENGDSDIDSPLHLDVRRGSVSISIVRSQHSTGSISSNEDRVRVMSGFDSERESIPAFLDENAP